MWPLYFLSKILNVEANVDESELTDHLAGKWQANPVSLSHFVEVPHINQLHSWDCGLACIVMVLNTVGICDCSIEALEDMCDTNSVWTVDLAFLLKRFSVRFSYCTVTIGANPHFSVEKYYKEQLPTDLVRVDMLFEKASKEGIKIQCRSINEKQISCLILSGKYIIIALVNQYKLRYVISRMFVLEFVINWTCHLVGHYIVICGYDSDSDEFEIRDPASSRKHERISSKCLEEARKSFGTDEDLLLVN
ncbi:Guanylyl cyclase 1 [Linum perenne]